MFHLHSAAATVAALVWLLTTPSLASAQSAAEPEPPRAPDATTREPLLIGATLETYYQYNWNRAPDRTLPLRAYDHGSNSFSLQQVGLVLDAPPDVAASRRYSGRLDLQFGQATEAVQGGAANEPRPDVYRHLWQAYGSYVLPIGPEGLQLDLGKFASSLGYESNYAKDNQTFSRAWLFNFLPFYHAGLRLTLPVNQRLTATYVISNGVQQTEDFNDFKSHHVGLILRPAPGLVLTLNWYAGREQPDDGNSGGPDGRLTILDTYATLAATSALTIGFNVNHTSNHRLSAGPSLSLTGLAGYARYQVAPRISAGVRYERLADEGLFVGTEQILHEVTLTGEYRLDEGLVVRAEYRRDASSEPFFPGPSGVADLRRSQPTALVAAIWVFGNKKGTW